MANFTFSSSSLSGYPIISAAAGGGSSSSGAAFDDDFEEACSICLEPFTTQDPSTVTGCKHEYHLQCILEWSQRSKECPICWQMLVLKEPACQELLAAVQTERRLRSRSTSAATSANQLHFHEDFDAEQDFYSNDSDFDDRIMQHIAAASRAHYINRRERQRYSDQGPSQFLFFTSPANGPNAQQIQTSAEEGLDINNGSLGSNSPTPVMVSQPLASLVPPVVNVVSGTAVNRDVPSKARVFFGQLPTDSPRSPSEAASLSESIKSKWLAASARYKESISKGTRGIKEKLLARNSSVKELGKGVQREMSAGIAGVARMIERLDFTSKRTGASNPVSGFRAGAPDLSKGIQENIIAQALKREREEIANCASVDASSHAFCTVPGQMEAPHPCTEKVIEAVELKPGC
ncbi:hypothetical protein JCGZ_02129 [Jatropha curcas]|uniref:RING-type E3 ubiquitin transferase n=1 Tax=Jatropha curcas TaxID=180498 RepID=A0A067KV90_JATCU|nr:E3 ubiquitin-protein ligase RHF1A [Jatropha curcas]KDP40131.1 hypothetical protein JCGZ_02129 [Jatropha curcas]